MQCHSLLIFARLLNSFKGLGSEQGRLGAKEAESVFFLLLVTGHKSLWREVENNEVTRTCDRWLLARTDGITRRVVLTRRKTSNHSDHKA
uniref:Secreted protein n=1 Tax=Steinernema glaseri TaxID=37863 RepID=A0A1I8ACN4_9BILA